MKSRIELFKEFIDSLEYKTNRELQVYIDYFESEKIYQAPRMVSLLSEIQDLCIETIVSR